MKITLLAILIALSLCLSAATVNFETAGDLQRDCQTGEDMAAGLRTPIDAAYKAGHCTGFIDGFLNTEDGSEWMDDDGKVWEVRFEDGVTVGQAEDVFLLYMSKHPELENKPAAAALIDATADAKIGHKYLVIPKPKKN